MAYFGRLFTTRDAPADLALDALASVRPGDDALRWIDLVDPSEEELAAVWDACELPAIALDFVRSGTTPEVGQEGAYFWVRSVLAGEHTAREKLTGTLLLCVAGCNTAVTIHGPGVAFLDEMRAARSVDGRVGALSAESFVATLLDRQLASYFDAVGKYEMAIERLEVDLLGKNVRDSLPELQRLRRWASRLRRMLAPHRNVFGVMARPDFRPDEGREADRHFVALDARFERAMDMVEHARELVIGSFELFSSQTALRTNDAMRVLTFVTVITGFLATVVGALGMNFQASFFKSNDLGFWIATGTLLTIAVAGVFVGRRQHWF